MNCANRADRIVSPGELLSPGPLDVMDEVGEEAGASSSTAVPDSDDSLPQPQSVPLVESIDEALVPDIIAGTPGTTSVFQSAWVASTVLHRVRMCVHTFSSQSALT